LGLPEQLLAHVDLGDHRPLAAATPPATAHRQVGARVDAVGGVGGVGVDLIRRLDDVAQPACGVKGSAIRRG
jgi:hypothetical protein